MLARRRIIAALCAAAAVVAALHDLRPAPPRTQAVVVAARDLAAGIALTSGDVHTMRLPVGARPAGSLAIREAVGRVLAAPVRQGEPITDVRLLGQSLTASYPGRVVVPVRLPDAGMVGLLRVGDRIDLVAADPQGGGAGIVAADLAVVALPAVEETTSGSLPGRLVVLAVPAPLRERLAQAAVAEYLTYAYTR